jgi:hypothetical protein
VNIKVTSFSQKRSAPPSHIGISIKEADAANRLAPRRCPRLMNAQGRSLGQAPKEGGL